MASGDQKLCRVCLSLRTFSEGVVHKLWCFQSSCKGPAAGQGWRTVYGVHTPEVCTKSRTL